MDNIKEEIIRMIDGELSSEESSKVMEAINESSELQAFYKAAQESTDSLQSYFNSEDISAANDRLKKSIKNLTQTKGSHKEETPFKENAFSWIRPFFENLSRPSIAVAAIALFAIVINVNFNENEDPKIFLVSDLGFSDAGKEFIISDYRSSEYTYIENELSNVMEKLVAEKISNATISLSGEENLKIFLRILEKSDDCFSGEISSNQLFEETLREFSYCLATGPEMVAADFIFKSR
jgi:hypothetical protein